MKATTARLAGEFTAALHYGPGPHPDGSPQAVHAGGQMSFDFEYPEESAAFTGKYLPTPETIATVEANIEDVLESNTMNPDREHPRETMAEAVDQLKEWATTEPLAIRAGAAAADAILQDGRFKTQFETQTSGGFFDPDFRGKSERKGLGIPIDVEPEERPIYGYLEIRGDEAGQYGGVAFMLKDEVKRRATVTASDSLGLFDSDMGAGTPALDPGPASLGEIAQTVAEGRSPYYIEAQIQGGVTVQDVKEIVFKQSAVEIDYAGKRPPRLRPEFSPVARLAKERGIPYRLDPENL